MRIGEPAAGTKPVLIAIGIAVSWLVPAASARAAPGFRIEAESTGRFRAFSAQSVPLSEFVKEYARVTSQPITVRGGWSEVKGTVTLFLRRPFSRERLTEIFFRTAGENGYAIVDAPAGNGWILMRGRDARDAALPVYAASEVPDSARLVTAHAELKHADAENVARMMRSFMPPASRIIPAASSRLIITDTATNIRKLNWVISRMDTPEAAKRARAATASKGESRSCGETRIQKLVVEKLEIQGSGNGSGFESGSRGGGSADAGPRTKPQMNLQTKSFGIGGSK